MESREKILKVSDWRDHGKIWCTAIEAGELLGVTSQALLSAANKKGTLGSLQFSWAGSKLLISTASLLHFLTGGLPIREIFAIGREVAG